MYGDFLNSHITSQAGFVKYGYGQVEPNHLSAQRTGQIYAQLPAAADIDVLENGQFVKYDYATGVCNFTGLGEWMLVLNEIKLYREHQMDCEFAMVKDNYAARVYSPFGGSRAGAPDTTDFNGLTNKQSRFYNGKDNLGLTYANVGGTRNYALATVFHPGQTYFTLDGTDYVEVENPVEADVTTYYEVTGYTGGTNYNYSDVTAGNDFWEPHYNEDPFHIEGLEKEAMMPANTTMVPRVVKTNVGDIITTNTIKDTTVAVGNILTVGANGILEVNSAPTAGTMQWQVVKVYTMPDHQPGVKIMRIA